MIALFHRTTKQAARAILSRGFKDSSGYYMIPRLTKGVWLSDHPLDANEGASGEVLIRVILRLNKRELNRYEWVEAGKPYREWQVPAALVNGRSVSLKIVPVWREDLWVAARNQASFRRLASAIGSQLPVITSLRSSGN